MKSKYIYITIFILLLGVLFYWYEWRPSQIKKECHISAKERAWAYDSVYKSCLNSKGI